MSSIINIARGITALLTGAAACALLLSSPAQAVGVECAEGADPNTCIANFEGGRWDEYGLGQCLYVLPTPQSRRIEVPVGPSEEATEDPDVLDVCIGGLSTPNLTTSSVDPNDDVAVRISRGGPGLEENAFAWSLDAGDAILEAAQFIPDNCRVPDFDFESLDFNLRNGAFDNGHDFDSGPFLVLEPLSAVLEMGDNVKGDATLTYYFIEAAAVCRTLDWTLTITSIDGSESTKSGTISNFNVGKYIQFDLSGLTGGEIVRLDVENKSQPVPGTLTTACATVNPDFIPGVNSHLGGVFVNGTSVCAAPPELVDLGDRLWFDLDADGIQDQDCVDTNKSGVIGDTVDGIADTNSDGGACEIGIDEVDVSLGLPGPNGCADSGYDQGTVPTENGGYYLFNDLLPGDYCVKFDKPPEEFCNSGDFQLGLPQFTLQGAGSEDDSDADTTTGNVTVSGLTATDLTIDAGIVCPAKIGDRVWLDDGDGVQEDVENGIENVSVELYECTDGVLDMDKFVGVRTTSNDPLMNYMFGAEGPSDELPDGFELPPGEYAVLFRNPDTGVYEFTSPNSSGPDANEANDSDCVAQNGYAITSCTTLGSRGIDLNQDCGLVIPPPNCGLTLDKTCSIVPKTSDNLLCESAIAATTLRYIGPPILGANVTFAGDKAGLAQYANVDLVSGTVLTMPEQNGFTIDSGDGLGSKTEITINGVLEIIHTSCSAIYSAGQPAPLDGNTPNPPNSDKGDPSPNWFVVNFEDKEGAFVSTPTGNGGDFADSCTFEKQPLPTCDNGEKPDMLTWRYDGGSANGICAGSTFYTIENEDGKRHEDFYCEGNVNTSTAITVMDDGGNSYLVNPGKEFTTPRDDIEEITLRDADGNEQTLEFHESCSQPLEAQATAGALTLVGLDDRTGGVDVTYRYTVKNNGDPLTVMVTDDKLGYIGGPVDLGKGDRAMFDSEPVTLFDTTVNTAYAKSSTCPTATDTVTVMATEPTCKVSIELYKVEDDKIKWKLSNSSGIDATIKNLTISWPGETYLEKVKFDGNDIVKDEALSGPDAELPRDVGRWLKEVKDRTLKAGDTEKIEFEFTDKFLEKDDQPASDFELEVTFEEGCEVSF